jgi:hypothetical protein
VPVTPDFVYLVSDCPHDWLFPQCAAVVSLPIYCDTWDRVGILLFSSIWLCLSRRSTHMLTWKASLHISFRPACGERLLTFDHHFDCDLMVIVSECICRFIMVGQAQQLQVSRLRYSPFPEQNVNPFFYTFIYHTIPLHPLQCWILLFLRCC